MLGSEPFSSDVSLPLELNDNSHGVFIILIGRLHMTGLGCYWYKKGTIVSTPASLDLLLERWLSVRIMELLLLMYDDVIILL